MLLNQLTPVLPSDTSIGVLREKSFELTKKASLLLPYPQLKKPLMTTVRMMNCYYSNIIEGHHTLPADIELALQATLHSDAALRNAQYEALAHIGVQTMMYRGEAPAPALSTDFLRWCHQQFYCNLPAAMLKVTSPDMARSLVIEPGRFRRDAVQVGQHLPPSFDDVEGMLASLFSVYQRCQGGDAIIAIAAANHRVAWIHPFVDGNGRTIRLMSDAALQHLGLNTGLWSPSRGLARRADEYKRLLAAADQPRQGSATDGRGALSEKGLVKFCDFYLSLCIDQVDFMRALFDLDHLLHRIRRYCEEEHQRSSLSLHAFTLLREVIFRETVPRGEVATLLTARSAVTARRAMKELLDRGLLVSDTPRGALRLAIPSHVLAAWFPDLYPDYEVRSK